jgi:hypothetical protein
LWKVPGLPELDVDPLLLLLLTTPESSVFVGVESSPPPRPFLLLLPQAMTAATPSAPSTNHL